LKDERLQRSNRFDRLAPEEREHLETMRREAIKAGAPEDVEWIYFSSPEWTWQALCGRAGWLLYDKQTGAQHAFWLVVMN